MVTWMAHEKHGRHPALGGEVEELKKQGWTIYVKNKKTDDDHAQLIESPISETLTVTKRGRPAKAK